MEGDTNIVIRFEIQDDKILSCEQSGNKHIVSINPDFVEDVFLVPFLRRLFWNLSCGGFTRPKSGDIQILHKSKESLDIFENAHDILHAFCSTGATIGTATIVCETKDEVPLGDFLQSLPPCIQEIHLGTFDATRKDVPASVWSRLPSLNVIRVLNSKGLEVDIPRPPGAPPCSKRRRPEEVTLFHKNPIDIGTSTANRIVVLPDGEDDERAVSYRIPSGQESSLVVRAIPYHLGPSDSSQKLVDWPDDYIHIDFPYRSIFTAAVVTKNAARREGATFNSGASELTEKELFGRVAFIKK